MHSRGMARGLSMKVWSGCTHVTFHVSHLDYLEHETLQLLNETRISWRLWDGDHRCSCLAKSQCNVKSFREGLACLCEPKGFQRCADTCELRKIRYGFINRVE